MKDTALSILGLLYATWVKDISSPASVSLLVKWESAIRKPRGPSELWWLGRKLAVSGTQSVTVGDGVSLDSQVHCLPNPGRHLGSQAEWCQVLSYSPPSLISLSPEKMEDDPSPGLLSSSQWANLKWATEPLLWKLGIMISYFSRKAERSPGMSHGPRGPLSWPGSSVHPLPPWQATVLCLFPLHQLPGMSSLTLPQHYASIEKRNEKKKKKKKVRPWNRPEIQCLHMVPSCPLFSNENALYDWGVTVKC